MKIGVSAFAWTTKLTDRHLDLVPALREHGIEGFEIPISDPAETPALRVRRAIEASQMDCTVCAILPAGINPISPDPNIRKRSQAHLLHCIETAAECGAQLIGGPLYAPNGYLPGRRRTGEEWLWVVECFQALGDSLAAHKMTLSIEPVNRSETFFLNTTADAIGLCKAINHPRIGLTIDTFHANIEEKNIAAAVMTAARQLRHLHASENDRGLLGSGHVDFQSIIAALRHIHYDGYLTIEGFGYSPNEPDCLGALWGDLNVTPEDIAFHGAQYLLNLLA